MASTPNLSNYLPGFLKIVDREEDRDLLQFILDTTKKTALNWISIGFLVELVGNIYETFLDQDWDQSTKFMIPRSLFP